MRRAAALTLAALAIATPIAPGFGQMAIASVSPATVSVADAAEAWYQPILAGLCATPLGCLPVPLAAPYPAHTLHVGELAGVPSARAYLLPDLSTIKSDEEASAGTMRLPLATMIGNGNLSTPAATIIACLVTARFGDGLEGSTGKLPQVDCSVRARAKVGTGAFSINLTPFLAAWNHGRPADGVALLPDPSGPSGATWQVGFNGRTLVGAPHVTTVLTLTQRTSVGGRATPVPTTRTGPTNAIPTTSTLSGEPPGLPPLGSGLSARPSNPLSPVVASSQTRSRRLALSKSFQYPELMLLPLIFIVGLVFTIKLLLSDATPRRRTL